MQQILSSSNRYTLRGAWLSLIANNETNADIYLAAYAYSLNANTGSEGEIVRGIAQGIAQNPSREQLAYRIMLEMTKKSYYRGDAHGSIMHFAKTLDDEDMKVGIITSSLLHNTSLGDGPTAGMVRWLRSNAFEHRLTTDAFRRITEDDSFNKAARDLVLSYK